MKQVIDHSCLRAVLAHLKVKSSIHVHRHRLDLRAAFRPQFFEEGPDCGPATSFADPQHPTGIGIQHNAGVAMPFEQGKLVHDQSPGTGYRQLIQFRL
ncbi:hypothetical protein D3C86_1981290 [compost metagenome]